MSEARVPARPRGRPKSTLRRDQIIQTAAALFHLRGYDNVSLKDVASEVGLTAPAIYRHFADKHDLLASVVKSGLKVVEDAVHASEASLNARLDALATAAVEREDFWLLVRRELKHLSAEERAEVLSRVAVVIELVQSDLTRARPDLDEESAAFLARASVASLSALSQYPRRIARQQAEGTIAVTSKRVAWMSFDASVDAPVSPVVQPFDPSISRREELLAIAAAQFAERGYQDVSLNDIAGQAGMAGPSLYHHFANKSDVLVAVLRRTNDLIELDWTRSIQNSSSPETTLAELVRNYVDLAMGHPELFQIFINESIHLPDADREWLLRSHTQFVQRWVTLAQRCRPDWDSSEAQLRVASALALVNDVASSRRLAELAGLRMKLIQAASVAIGLD
jgi:AcrR family transcriptional regulator